MATNYIQDGAVLDITAGAAYASGAVVAQGAVIGIALDAIANGALGAIRTEGVFNITVPTATVVAVGDVLDWDASATNFGKGITAASGDVENAMIAVAAAGNGVVTCYAKFTGAGTPA